MLGKSDAVHKYSDVAFGMPLGGHSGAVASGRPATICLFSAPTSPRRRRWRTAPAATRRSIPPDFELVSMLVYTLSAKYE